MDTPVKPLRSFYLIYLLSSIIIRNSRQSCELSKVQEGKQIIFRFTCSVPNDVNPELPYNIGSPPHQFNYLDLSPNLYVNISTTDLCQFFNILTLDISYNLLTTMADVFRAIKCFDQIQNLFAHDNQISTPLLGN
jgi:hypothetical protein